ncbi:rRNA pseudouridine synthase [Staphylococcus sp. ACRSN]|uniref:pseudouridine synthase n=1 Tax=Staphylococcus sp. ACRSN TaxID=2918214 RepID=UPI001EF28146|nr:pseudouridine synthase [Staphylococcus sp. ACRSN]MCG7338409.1 rRNA pseudouridine synthase [Staphylococcus sp. ACRSN]
MRLDKFLSNMGVGSRTEVKQLLKQGAVTLNSQKEKSPKVQINPDIDQIKVNGKSIAYIDKVYLMLNKPKGYISATRDDLHQTVIDLIDEYDYLDIFPVGRLDKDTEGLILITNDGEFNHQLMSPTKHVPKTYEVFSEKTITNDDIKLFKTGIELSEGLTKPAHLELGVKDKQSFVTISEGKYHQIKRMYHAIDNEVKELKRVRIGELSLEDDLIQGTYRHLTEQDFKKLGLK